MVEKNKWLALIILILFSGACSLEGNLGGETTYIVSFDKNGGDGGSPPSQKIKSSSSVRLPSGNSLSKEDFTFGGWNTDSSGAGKNYSADSFYTPTGNVTLYANWIPATAPTYTVTFDGNGANGTPPAPQEAKAGSSITLPSGSGLTKSGYTFNGWNTDVFGAGDQYSEGSSYSVDEDITLYANWASPGITYTVTFSANGGSGTPPSRQVVSGGSSITLPNGSGLSKSGSTFGGWNTNASGSGELYGVGSSYVPYSNITLYANWNASNANGPIVVPGANLAAKLVWLQSNAQNGCEYTVEVSSNESIGPAELSYSGKGNIAITLKGIGQARTISLAYVGSMFTVDSGVTLILDNNIILQGRNSNTNSLVRVKSGGTLVMNAGASITGNTNASFIGGHYGGGVVVEGTFTMNAGEISGNTDSTYGGGGVYVSEMGTFTMNNGEISGNNHSSTGYGGGVFADWGTFTMNGGKISGNTNTAGSGGGCMVTGIFTMNGGEISGNATGGSGGGVIVGSGIFTMKAGEISGNTSHDGGGVNVSGTFTMDSGKISGNIGDYGGGVSVGGGIFTMNGGEVSGNTAFAFGGGVLFAQSASGKFMKTGGGTIYGYTGGDANSNVVKNSSGVVQNNRGHVVFAATGTSNKRRETTAGPTVNLDSALDGAAGGWE